MRKANVLGVIPARGGSKGIPKKNIVPLNGHPLIAYSIWSAKKSKTLTYFIVSTDSQEIAEVAKTYGADVPFMRPAGISGDRALSSEVMKHAVKEIEAVMKTTFDFIVLLQPTTPLRTSEDIDQAVQKLMETGCDSVITVAPVGAYHPARMYELNGDRILSIMDEGVKMRPRQELPPIYIRSGDVYACKREVLLKEGTMMGRDTRAIVIPEERAVNIDNRRDIILAEIYMKSGGIRYDT